MYEDIINVCFKPEKEFACFIENQDSIQASCIAFNKKFSCFQVAVLYKLYFNCLYFFVQTSYLALAEPDLCLNYFNYVKLEPNV